MTNECKTCRFWVLNRCYWNNMVNDSEWEYKRIYPVRETWVKEDQMETFIGWILIFTAITFFSWFIYGMDAFTVKEKVRNFLLSEIFLITISIGAYMITGGK